MKFLFANSLRRSLTLTIYQLMGLRIVYWRQRVEQLWALAGSDRKESLSQWLQKTKPNTASGEVISAVEQLDMAPPLSKAILRNRTDSMVSREKLFSRHTAGTSGTPTHILLNRDELGRMLAVRDYCYSHYGLRLGDREGRVWGRASSGWKAMLKNYAMNRRIFHPAGDRALAEVKALLKYQPRYIYGYSSLILEAARLIEANDLEVPVIRCVICTAETILPVQKKFLETVFKAPTIEEYGSTEFDIIAFECKDGHQHLVNPWLIVDPKENDCLITDVSRITQDIVRYESGDCLQVANSTCGALGGSSVVDVLEGRSADQFAYLSETKKFHAVELGNAFEEFMIESKQIFVFAVIQKDYGLFHIELAPGEVKDEERLVQSLTEYFHQSMGVLIKFVVVSPSTLYRENYKNTYFINELMHNEK